LLDTPAVSVSAVGRVAAGDDSLTATYPTAPGVLSEPERYRAIRWDDAARVEWASGLLQLLGADELELPRQSGDASAETVSTIRAESIPPLEELTREASVRLLVACESLAVEPSVKRADCSRVAAPTARFCDAIQRAEELRL